MKTTTKKTLTPAQKRVRIAKDVLIQLKSRRYTANPGTVFRLGANHFGILMRPDLECSQSLVKHSSFCTVCAKGSALLAYVERFNKVTIAQLRDGCQPKTTHKVPGFRRVFPKRILAELETLFERKSYELALNCLPGYLRNEMIAFSKDHLSGDPDERLAQIMRRLVRNKGEFVQFPQVAGK